MKQLDLFQQPTDTNNKICISDGHAYFIEFKEYMMKLIGNGAFFSIEENWWRSRYHDWLYPGHNQAKTKEEWIWRHERQIAWHTVWPYIIQFIEENKPWKLHNT